MTVEAKLAERLDEATRIGDNHEVEFLTRLLESMGIHKHYGPGPHPSGSSQDAHAGKGGGGIDLSEHVDTLFSEDPKIPSWEFDESLIPLTDKEIRSKLSWDYDALYGEGTCEDCGEPRYDHEDPDVGDVEGHEFKHAWGSTIYYEGFDGEVYGNWEGEAREYLKTWYDTPESRAQLYAAWLKLQKMTENTRMFVAIDEEVFMREVMDAVSPFSTSPTSDSINDTDEIQFFGNQVLHNQHGTGSSNGWFNPDMRAGLEQVMWGHDTPSEEVPIYGYLSSTPFAQNIDQYGDVRIELQDNMRDTTTFTLGDSLDDQGFLYGWNGGNFEPIAAPTSLATPDWVVLDRHVDEVNNYDNLEEITRFAEAQYWEGVSIDRRFVKAVHVVWPSEYWTAEWEAFARHTGIPVHFYNAQNAGPYRIIGAEGDMLNETPTQAEERLVAEVLDSLGLGGK